MLAQKRNETRREFFIHMAVIQIDHLTKDYGHNRGVFDVSFKVEKGEVYGFLGPNGAGKTTTIRHIMGILSSASWENLCEWNEQLGKSK
ncbi:ATP-binding cassette domain-containing protein [Bacillus pacificus]